MSKRPLTIEECAALEADLKANAGWSNACALGFAPSRIVSKRYSGETKKQYRERMSREFQMLDDMDHEHRRDGSGRIYPVRYDD